jgi:excisionase family DNA binding protein
VTASPDKKTRNHAQADGSKIKEQFIAGRRLVSIETVGEYLSITPRTVRRRVADGTFRAYRIGRLVRIDLNEVDTTLPQIPTGGC